MNSDYEIGSDNWPGLSKVVEESGELLQVLGKIMGTGGETEYWDGTDLAERLREEIADLTAALDFFQDMNFNRIYRKEGDWLSMKNRISYKLGKFRFWHEKNRKG